MELHSAPNEQRPAKNACGHVLSCYAKSRHVALKTQHAAHRTLSRLRHLPICGIIRRLCTEATDSRITVRHVRLQKQEERVQAAAPNKLNLASSKARYSTRTDIKPLRVHVPPQRDPHRPRPTAHPIRAKGNRLAAYPGRARCSQNSASMAQPALPMGAPTTYFLSTSFVPKRIS